jgi:hypothetical protein
MTFPPESPLHWNYPCPTSRAFKTNDVIVPGDLGDRIAAALRLAALDRLGLEARSGMLLNGAEKIEAAGGTANAVAK